MRRKAGLGAIQKRKVDAEKFKYVFVFFEYLWKSWGPNSLTSDHFGSFDV